MYFRSYYEDGRFDNAFPLVLHQKNVSPNIYQQTLEGCSTIINTFLSPMKDVKRIAMVFNGLILILCPLALVVPGILYAVKEKIWQEYIMFGFPAIIGFTIVSLIFIAILKGHQMRKIHQRARDAVIDFLRRENTEKYDTLGVKMELRYDTFRGFSPHKTTMLVSSQPPYIETLVDVPSPGEVLPVPEKRGDQMPNVTITTRERPFEKEMTSETPLENTATENQPLLGYHK
jgi:hypothetical protein